MAMDGLKVPAAQDPAAASGGERRRAALARVLANDPDLLLLDEPTNHLDIEAIAWLEERLRQTRKAFVLVSHDRAVLRALTRRILWVDRGAVRSLDRGFEHFEDWRDKVFEEEAQSRHKLDRLIKQESVWAVEGISARRKRNQGRVRRLQDMKAERRAQRAQTGTAAMALESGPASGKRVIEAEDISKSYDGRTVIRDFSQRIMRGERVAFVGPNGAGKTTLIKRLTGEVAPDTGTVTLGHNLVPAVFDQARAALKPEASLWESLTLDPQMAVDGRSDQVMVRGRPKHVVGYLKDFLFDERQARGPVKALSGGERARLLLARIMARESNLLILDEPTNDLDVETLDLLQELVADYAGTVLLVSHDRDFLDRTATTTVVLEGDGRATVYAGGWSDMVAQRGEAPMGTPKPEEPAAPKPKPAAEKSAKPAPKPAAKLSFKQSRRLDQLPEEIARLESEIARLEGLLADPDLYARDPAKFDKATAALTRRQAALETAEEEWLELEALREAVEG
jgi:ATP-binding cassette subfamily F protein uup